MTLLKKIKNTFNKKEFPIFIRDNFFSKEEQDLIFNGFDKIHELNLFSPPEKTGSAKCQETLLSLKKNDGYFMVPENIEDVHIKCLYETVNKIFSNLTFEYSKINVWTSTILNTTQHSALVSYYEDGDYYSAHRDSSIFTVLMWFYRKPKKFLGGNLFLHDIKKEIEVKNNRLVIIPSRALHSVSPIVLQNEDLHNRNGRYCITLFLN